MAVKAADTISLVKVSDGKNGAAGRGVAASSVTYQASDLQN